MIGDAARNGFGPVHLFEQHHTGKFVRQGQRSQGKNTPARRDHRRVQSVGSAHNEAGTGIGRERFQKAGKRAGGQRFSMLVKAERNVARGERGENGPPFLVFALLHRQGGIAVLHFAHGKGAPARQSFHIMGGRRFPERGFQSADRNKAQGFQHQDPPERAGERPGPHLSKFCPAVDARPLFQFGGACGILPCRGTTQAGRMAWTRQKYAGFP